MNASVRLYLLFFSFTAGFRLVAAGASPWLSSCPSPSLLCWCSSGYWLGTGSSWTVGFSWVLVCTCWLRSVLIQRTHLTWSTVQNPRCVLSQSVLSRTRWRVTSLYFRLKLVKSELKSEVHIVDTLCVCSAFIFILFRKIKLYIFNKSYSQFKVQFPAS